MQRTPARTSIRRVFGVALATSALAVAGAVQASAADGLGAFTCTNKSGGVAGVPGTVASIRVAHHDGYDRLVFEFAPSAAGAIPAYRLTQQSSATFTQDASGQLVTLAGSAGIKTVFQNTTEGPGAPRDLKTGQPEIREVRNIGDFERVTSYGIGLSKAACFRAIELSVPMRLVIDVVAPSTVTATAAPQPAASAAPVASQSSDVTTPQDLAATGHARQVAGTPATPALSLLPILAILLGIGCVALGALVAVQRGLLRR